MGHWNYRVVKSKKWYGEIWYEVREVYYDDEGNVNGYTEEPGRPVATGLQELREVLEWMIKSLDKPVLVDGEVEFEDKKPKKKRRKNNDDKG